ncbi:hypothetical protein [Microbacterium sp. zg.Y909]|uniref:hypothetical protein n=1 Tax=Microbacterium sp. zg.Y909 TaxID=2969413 RepID=UPI00214AFBCE|nr:hypothetical protein [Microbacterium sp. zg.Y909]MCR2825295.1 hypothetical protein [Microbacterium sp. zg.Y909]
MLEAEEGVSTAAINVIDDRWQHPIAVVGFEPVVCAREDSMCAAVLPADAPSQRP